MRAAGSLSSPEVSRPVLCGSLRGRPFAQAALANVGNMTPGPARFRLRSALALWPQASFNPSTLIFSPAPSGIMVAVWSQDRCENEMSGYVKQTEECVAQRSGM